MDDPCFASATVHVECWDKPAPGVGYICGECPPGTVGDGEVCGDVDECADSGCDSLTTCTNEPGGFSCGACPEDHLGDGVLGCRPVGRCEENNGGCDPLTTCTEVNVTIGVHHLYSLQL